jgi:hypothetical protein
MVSELCWEPGISHISHRGMVRPRVEDGRDGLQLWRLAANILNKQPRSNDKGWSPAWDLGMGLTTLHRKKQTCYEKSHRASDLDGFLDKRPMRRNMEMRFGMWNIRSLCRVGSLMTV